MMDFMNGGFNLMGDIFGDDFEMPDPAPKKEKKAAKKEEKTDSKKTVSKKTAKKLAKVTLPCKVYGGSFRLEIPGNGEEVDTARLSELIAEAGYIEVKNSSMSVYVPEDLKSTAYVVTDAASFATGNDIAADFSNNQEIVFACGDERLTMKPEDFEGKDEDEICVKDLGDRISECFPHYKGEFCYDIASATIVPVRRKADLIDDKTTIPLPAVFCVSGEEHLLNEESLSGKEPTAKNIVDLLTASFSHKNIHCYLYKMDEQGALQAPLLISRQKMIMWRAERKWILFCIGVLSLPLINLLAVVGNIRRITWTMYMQPGQKLLSIRRLRLVATT